MVLHSTRKHLDISRHRGQSGAELVDLALDLDEAARSVLEVSLRFVELLPGRRAGVEKVLEVGLSSRHSGV